MATKEELLEKLKTGVVEYQEDVVKEAAQQSLDDGPRSTRNDHGRPGGRNGDCW